MADQSKGRGREAQVEVEGNVEVLRWGEVGVTRGEVG